jgi:hypothetical protein
MGNSTKEPELKNIFDQYAEEAISDERAERVLAPVTSMIRAGVFDRPRKRRCPIRHFFNTISIVIKSNNAVRRRAT